MFVLHVHQKSKFNGGLEGGGGEHCKGGCAAIYHVSFGREAGPGHEVPFRGLVQGGREGSQVSKLFSGS